MERLARSRVDKVLEIDHFIKYQIQFRILLRTILTKAEQFLLSNQRKFVIDARSNSDKSDRSESEDIQKSFDTDSKYFSTLLEGTMISKRLNEDTQENEQL